MYFSESFFFVFKKWGKNVFKWFKGVEWMNESLVFLGGTDTSNNTGKEKVRSNTSTSSNTHTRLRGQRRQFTPFNIAMMQHPISGGKHCLEGGWVCFILFQNRKSYIFRKQETIIKTSQRTSKTGTEPNQDRKSRDAKWDQSLSFGPVPGRAFSSSVPLISDRDVKVTLPFSLLKLFFKSQKRG